MTTNYNILSTSKIILETEYDDEQDYEPLKSTVDSGYSSGSEVVENWSDQDLKKEMIRQTMSELGKRSAIAKSKRKSS